MAKVILKNVGKIYPGNVRAVADFSLEIADGEFVVLVGPSGCGKTTVLRALAGLDRPATGRIAFDGEPWFDAARGIDLPPQARAYVERLVALVGGRLGVLSVGPGRETTLRMGL